MSKFEQANGLNFASAEDVSVTALAAILRKIAAYLRAESPSARLEKYEDWWEHDGLHFYQNPISIDDLFTIVRTPKSLLESMPGDFRVFIGIHSKEIPLYLRFYVYWNDDETDLLGRFDVTVPNERADRFRKEVIATSEVEIREMSSLEYYRSIIL